jgi:FkbM family methyltransferase
VHREAQETTPMTLPPMLSYAQNAEDVVLRRAFPEPDIGFYIDVGAGHPIEDSVTHHFYERGWRGINVEPDTPLFAELTAVRARDSNLCVAIGSEPGHVTFYPTGTRGHGTLSLQLAAERLPGPEPRKVPKVPLSQVFERHASNEEVHFLKIDVESAEEDVIASGDFSRHRPHVLVVEAMDSDGHPTHASWEPLLFEAGYSFALFDGLNRFYCSKEQEELLLPRLAVPANIFDNYRLAREARALEASAARAEAEAIEVRSLEQALEHLKQELRLAHEARDVLGVERDTVQELERLLARERAARDLDYKQREEMEARTSTLLIERDHCALRARQAEDSLAEDAPPAARSRLIFVRSSRRRPGASPSQRARWLPLQAFCDAAAEAAVIGFGRRRPRMLRTAGLVNRLRK